MILQHQLQSSFLFSRFFSWLLSMYSLCSVMRFLIFFLMVSSFLQYDVYFEFEFQLRQFLELKNSRFHCLFTFIQYFCSSIFRLLNQDFSFYLLHHAKQKTHFCGYISASVLFVNISEATYVYFWFCFSFVLFYSPQQTHFQ